MSSQLVAEESKEPEPTQATVTQSPSIPTNRLLLSSLNVFRLNPLGLETQDRLMFQHRLMDSQSVLFNNTFASAGLGVKLNPAFIKVGPVLELQPIALFHLRAGYEFMQFFGTFDHLQSFPDPSYPYDDDFRGDVNAENAYVTSGHHLLLEPTLQLKGGPVVVRSKWAFEYWKMGVSDAAIGTAGTADYEIADGVTDSVFYDATLDTLVPADGMMITTDNDLLYLKGKLTVGLRYSAVLPRYSDAQWPTGEPSDAVKTSHHRIGPLVAYQLKQRDFSSLNKPTLLLVGGYYVSHQSRSQISTPYVLIGFGFSSDLL